MLILIMMMQDRRNLAWLSLWIMVNTMVLIWWLQLPYLRDKTSFLRNETIWGNMSPPVSSVCMETVAFLRLWSLKTFSVPCVASHTYYHLVSAVLCVYIRMTVCRCIGTNSIQRNRNLTTGDWPCQMNLRPQGLEFPMLITDSIVQT